MQEETNEKTIALYIKTGKLTAQQLQKAMKALLAQMKKQHDKQKIPHGKQTLKQLILCPAVCFINRFCLLVGSNVLHQNRHICKTLFHAL